MTSPLFSVIIPTYNAEKTLAATLDSLLEQRFTDFEVVVADGQSKDNTLEILQQYSGADKRVRFFSEKDKGIYDAMNKGVKASRGEWLYFMGSDDTLLSNDVLLNVSLFIEKSRSVFIYGNVLMGNSKHWYDGLFTYEKLLQKNISHQAIFYNRKVFDLVGNYVIEYKTHADWAFNISCFKNKSIQPEYMNVLVARFGVEGVSWQHDVTFLREFLLFERLFYLSQAGTHTLKKISLYDEWWRLFRNAGIANKEQLTGYTGDLPVPVALLSMLKMQRMFSPRLLKTGVFSKSFMFISYIFNRVSGTLEGD
jgi:glycosyltransferase involved in cell wall biosynthesis